MPVTRFVVGSMRTSLPGGVIGHPERRSPIAASPFGSTPTLIVFTTRVPVMRETVPSPEFDTQAEPKPHSTSYGAVADANRRRDPAAVCVDPRRGLREVRDRPHGSG